jgi:hypothetical protein
MFLATITKKRPRIIFIAIIVILSVLFAFFVIPLTLNSPQTVAAEEPSTMLIQESSTQSDAQFNVTLMYAYTGLNSYEGKELNSTFMGTEMHPASLYPDIIYLNFTYIANPDTEQYSAKIGFTEFRLQQTQD